MKSSLQIHNEIRDLDGRIAKATADFAAAEGDARDALRDAINEYKGEQKALSDMLGDVLAAEDEVRRGGGVPLAAGTLEAPKSTRTLAEELYHLYGLTYLRFLESVHSTVLLKLRNQN